MENQNKTKFLILAYDKIGVKMAGPAIRSWEIAHALSNHAEVTIAHSEPIERESDLVNTVHFKSDSELEKLVKTQNVILIQGLAMRRYHFLQRCEAVRVVDMYDPWVLENLEMHAERDDIDATAHLLADADVQNELIDYGDFFICASERQRDYWLGMLTSRLRLDRATWKQNLELRDLIDVVAYGTPTEAPIEGPALRASTPAVKDNDTIFLWSGGTWEWFDPLTVLEGFALAQKDNQNMVLYFMGLGIKGRTPDMPVAKQLEKRAVELNLLGDRVIFGDWVDYNKRDAHLLEADAAVLATKPSAESRLAFRSRMLDHFWTGLPTLTTPGDILADTIAANNAGLLVDNSVESWRSALVEIYTNEILKRKLSDNARELAKKYSWDKNTLPLVRVVENPDSWIQTRDLRIKLRDKCKIPDYGLQGTALMIHKGFHSRGPLMDSLKRSWMYPFMRKVRRRKLGLLIWGPVPGE